MSDSTTNPPTPPTPAAAQPKKPQVHSPQRKETRELATTAFQKLTTIQNSPTLTPLYAAEGWDAARITPALSEAQALTDAIAARQEAMSAETQASTDFQTADATLQRLYGDVRKAEYKEFKDAAMRELLGLDTPEARDFQTFATDARVQLNAALNNTIVMTQLARAGITATKIHAALTALDDAVAKNDALRMAEAAAATKTQARAQAEDTVHNSMGELDLVTARLQRDHPELGSELRF